MLEQKQLHVVSWNVAGWTKTLGEIRRHCKTLTEWMNRHEIDILCLQEVKGNLQKLESSEAQALFAAKEPEFDSFFSLCTANTEGGGLGFNGVATFAKKGLTLTANSKPFGQSDLDVQGRCIVTDHGSFILFNVYAPYDGMRATRLGLKMRFLKALQMKMDEARKIKPVVLVGDLNLKYRIQDVCAGSRRVDLQRLFAVEQQAEVPDIMKRLHHQLVTLGGLRTLKQALSEVISQEFGACDKDGKRKVRVLVRHPQTNELKRLNPGELWHQDQVDAFAPFEENSTSEYTAKTKDTLYLHELQLFTETLLDMKWTKQDVDELAQFAHGAVYAGGALCTKQWMERLLDTMQDSFIVANGPQVSERYTVWNTRTNERYINAGSRIDFILVDPELTVGGRSAKLVGCDCDSEICQKPKICALQACTAFGRWQPAPMQGGGLPEATTADFNTQFRTQSAHTGIIYTPPTCSDHVAISCVLQFNASGGEEKLVLNTKDPATKASRPYARQLSLMDFGIAKKTKLEQ